MDLLGWIQDKRCVLAACLAQAVVFCVVIAVALLTSPLPVPSKVTGECYNCHTMHNSQGGATMNKRATPRGTLLRTSCLGCHAMNTTNKIETIGGNNVPQVRHRDSTGDLAGGNFAYMLGGKGSGASDAKGHNVMDFGNLEDTLVRPPGFVRLSGHYTVVPAGDLTCAGQNGCHGQRCWGGDPGCAVCHWDIDCTPMKGTHHRDVDGQLSTADHDYNSYRFLWGVKGYEISDWQNTSPTHHNDYFGFVMPWGYSYQDCSSTDGCHDYDNATIYAPSQTMSGFCATCHGDFHQVSGIKGIRTTSPVAPFMRHPTDVAMPSTGEYTGYTIFNVTAPVSRNWVPSAPVSGITLSNVQVMCLSCHVAHASDYPDMLRWDYSTIIAGGGPNNTGCFVCHTTKDTGG